MKPLKTANLPGGKVCLAAVSAGETETARRLHSLGIQTLAISPAPAISDGTRAHADLHILHVGGSMLFLSLEQRDKAAGLKKLGFEPRLLPAPLGAEYPKDVALNAALFGHVAIFNPATLFEGVSLEGRVKIPVRQGYAKCSVCPVDAHSFITDDPGIFTAAQGRGLDVLKVEKGDVLLQGREYGFIGGCCGLIAPDIMLFNGELRRHRNAEKIEDFLHRHGVRALSCAAGPLTDIGGIIPLCE